MHKLHNIKLNITDSTLRRGVFMLAIILALNLLSGIAVADTKKHPASKMSEALSYQLPAENGDSTADSIKEKDEPVFVTVLSFIFKLAVVLALAYATIYALKKITGIKSTAVGSHRRIKIIENAALGTNRSLHLIEVGKERLLVASTPSNISLLTVLNQDQDGADDAIESESIEPTQSGFGQHLSAFMGGGRDAGDAAGSVAQSIRGSSAFLQEKIMQLGRLRRHHRDD